MTKICKNCKHYESYENNQYLKDTNKGRGNCIFSPEYECTNDNDTCDNWSDDSMIDEYEYFKGNGTYNRNEVRIGNHDRRIYVEIGNEYMIHLPIEEVDKMILYLQKLRDKVKQ